jgi:hypothetical protein
MLVGVLIWVYVAHLPPHGKSSQKYEIIHILKSLSLKRALINPSSNTSVGSCKTQSQAGDRNLTILNLNDKLA